MFYCKTVKTFVYYKLSTYIIKYLIMHQERYCFFVWFTFILGCGGRIDKNLNYQMNDSRKSNLAITRNEIFKDNNSNAARKSHVVSSDQKTVAMNALNDAIDKEILSYSNNEDKNNLLDTWTTYFRKFSEINEESVTFGKYLYQAISKTMKGLEKNDRAQWWTKVLDRLEMCSNSGYKNLIVFLEKRSDLEKQDESLLFTIWFNVNNFGKNRIISYLVNPSGFLNVITTASSKNDVLKKLTYAYIKDTYNSKSNNAFTSIYYSSSMVSYNLYNTFSEILETDINTSLALIINIIYTGLDNKDNNLVDSDYLNFNIVSDMIKGLNFSVAARLIEFMLSDVAQNQDEKTVIIHHYLRQVFEKIIQDTEGEVFGKTYSAGCLAAILENSLRKFTVFDNVGQYGKDFTKKSKDNLFKDMLRNYSSANTETDKYEKAFSKMSQVGRKQLMSELASDVIYINGYSFIGFVDSNGNNTSRARALYRLINQLDKVEMWWLVKNLKRTDAIEGDSGSVTVPTTMYKIFIPESWNQDRDYGVFYK